MASSAAPAPSTATRPLQTAAGAGLARLEGWLETERDQLALWIPVVLGAGVAAWFVLPDAAAWRAAGLAALGVTAAAAGLARGGRTASVAGAAALAFAIGLASVWWRAERVAAPVLDCPVVARVTGTVDRVEPLPARDLVRLTLVALDWGEGAPRRGAARPLRVRLNLATRDVPAGVTPGARIALRGRFMPPPPAALPGAYDFARVAWFDGLGATGRGFAPVEVVTPGAAEQAMRARLGEHIQARLPGSAGGVAAALVTGDTGAIADADAEAMRRAGLAHLLSVSGLHISAVVGLVMLVAGRLLALWPRLALTGRVPLIAAAAAAGAALGYTWLAGGQVPTVRSCVAALMVLASMAMGREAVTLRLVAVGALVVLLAWPEALVGASFQLSFAAVTAIVALHELPATRRWLGPREEGRAMRLVRGMAGLLLTGAVVELTLMPIAVYHFHKAGLYGALANIVAIPLTTFVVMPAEFAALALDGIGLGWPAWWVTDRSLAVLLWLARTVAALPGASMALPAMPGGAFALVVGGGLWLALWRTRWRLLGVPFWLAGAAWTLATPAPDLLVTGDGRHLAVRDAGGRVFLLRERAGDYARDMLAENAGANEGAAEAAASVDMLPGAACNRDLCRIVHRAGGRDWIILATRSGYLVPAWRLSAACRASDIVVSERGLPRGCQSRWLRLDRRTLARSGGVAITLATGRVRTVRTPGDEHPWVLVGGR